MRHFRNTVCALALTVAPAWSQSAQELAQQYVNMPQVQTMVDNMFSPQSMVAQFAANLPPNVSISDQKKEKIGVVLSEAMGTLRPRLEELMISESAKVFSVAELQALIDFYGSEHGAAIMMKMQPYMVQVMGALGPDMVQVQQRITPDLVAIMQEPE